MAEETIDPKLQEWAKELVDQGKTEQEQIQLEFNQAYSERIESTKEKPKAEKRLIILDLSTKGNKATKSITLADPRIGLNNSEVYSPAQDDTDLPTDFENIAGVIFSGSAANIEDKPDRPWIETVENYMRNLLEHEISVLGICFGVQLHADMEGREVKRNLGGTNSGVWKSSIFLDHSMVDNPFFKGAKLQKDESGENASMVVNTLGFHNFRIEHHGEQQGYSYPTKEYYDNDSGVDGEPLPMIEIDGNFYGVQFHPEADTDLGIRASLAGKKAAATKTLEKGQDPTVAIKELESYLKETRSGKGLDERSNLLLRNFLNICGVE